MAIIMAQEFGHLEEETEQSREGDAAHEMGQEMIELHSRAAAFTWATFEGRRASNDVPFTREMYESAKVYADDVQAVMRHTGTFVTHTEAKLHMPRIHPMMWGTTDNWLLWEAKRRIYIWDFKHGFGLVEADTWQGVSYMCGVLEFLMLNGYIEQDFVVEFRIVQPRGFHSDGTIRSKVYTVNEWRPLFNHLANQCAEADSMPSCTTGDHCRYCPGLGFCGAATQAGYSAIDLFSKTPEIQNLTPQELGLLLKQFKRGLKALEFKAEALEKLIFRQMGEGTRNPHYRTESKLGHFIWPEDMDREEFKAVMATQGVDPVKPEEFYTPRQLMDKRVNEDLVKFYAERKPSTVRLVECNRDNEAKEVFGK